MVCNGIVDQLDQLDQLDQCSGSIRLFLRDIIVFVAHLSKFINTKIKLKHFPWLD